MHFYVLSSLSIFSFLFYGFRTMLRKVFLTVAFLKYSRISSFSLCYCFNSI